MVKGIYKRGNIYWIRYAGLDGKIKFESSHSTKFKDAETLFIKRKQAVREGKQPDVKRVSNSICNELVTEYIRWAERQKSFNSKRSHIKRLSETFGNIPLRQFNSMMLEQYQTEMLSEGYKPSTVNRRIATLSHMLTKAAEWNMVGEDILKRMRKVKMLPENNRRLRYLLTEECCRLVNACDDHLKPIVTTALNTGMRKDEILGLRWDNVDLKTGFILLNQSQTKNSERKEIPISPTLVEMLKSLPRNNDVSYVFCNPRTKKRYGDIKRSFKTALKRAEIKNFKFHDLRHTFASLLVMAGIDLTTVKEMLGHKDIKMTLRYAHLAPSHKLKAIVVLDKVLNGPQERGIQKVYNLRETVSV